MGLNHRPWACLILGLTLSGIWPQVGGEPYLVWSQKTHMWARLRGILGEPNVWVLSSDRTFVGSVPDSNRTWHALAHDPVNDYIYWHDRTLFAFYRQPAEACLQERNTQGLEVVYRGRSSAVTGIAVDWNTQAVYFADDYYNLIGVCGIGTGLARDVVQILFSTSISKPVGIAVQPDQGLLYWLDAETGHLVRSTLFGTGRENLLSGELVANAVSLAIDHQENALYWSLPNYGVRRFWLNSNMHEDAVFFQNNHIAGLAAFQDFIFLGDASTYAINIYRKSSSSYHSTYVIDADPHQLTIIEEPRSPMQDCAQLQCEQLCIRDDNGQNQCICGSGYQLEVDGRTCTRGKVSPIYIYSRGTSLWMAHTTITTLTPHRIDINETLVTRNKQLIQPVGFHYEHNFVYFGDTVLDVLYRISPGQSTLLEITVNTRQNEGISVDWLTNTMFWSDFTLGHVMCSKLDGRFHKIVIENLDGPRGLAVDASHGVMFWVQDGNSKSIRRARLDGTLVTTIVRENLYGPQALTADPRRSKLFWTDRNLNHIETADYDGDSRRIILQNSQTNLYGITIFKDYMTYTENDDPLKFAFEKTGERIYSIAHSTAYDLSTLMLGNSYDVVAYDNYLQPQSTNLCGTDNGGCQQLCLLVPPGDQPNTALSSRCACAIGFQLSDDRTHCISNMQTGNFVLFTDPYHKQVYQLALDGRQAVQGIPLAPQDFPVSIDVDPVEGRLFWIDRSKRTIQSSTFYGNELRTLWSYNQDSELERLAVDSVNRQLYVSDSRRARIIRLPLDALNIQEQYIVTVVDGLRVPFALALDQQNEVLYWTDTGAHNLGKMKFDGTERETIGDIISYPSGLTVSSNGNTNITTVYLSDQTDGTIYSYSPETGRISKIFQEPTLKINTLSSDGIYLYFSAWNEKAVYRWQLNSSDTRAIILGTSVFARIYDLHVYPGEVMLPIPVSVIPVTLYTGLGVLALIFLALLVALISFMAARRRQSTPPKAVAAGHDNQVYVNDEVTEFTNPQAFTTMEHGLVNSHAGNDGVSHNGVVDANGSIPQPPPMIPVVTGAAARKVQLRRGRELPPPPQEPIFQLSGNAQATVIQRLANRLRNRLSSVRFSKSPRNSGENWERETNVDTADGGNIPPQKTTPVQRGHIKVEPQLHRPPRGYAPASHAVPQTVKSTWSKAKAALAMGKR